MLKISGDISLSVNDLWVDKYRPQTIKEIIGNKEMVRKISAWLENW